MIEIINALLLALALCCAFIWWLNRRLRRLNQQLNSLKTTVNAQNKQLEQVHQRQDLHQTAQQMPPTRIDAALEDYYRD